MKKLGLIALLAITALVGCSKAPTEEDYKKWASENGYVQNPDYAGWADENGYVKDPDYAGWADENGYSKLEALPAARLEGKNTYNYTDSGVQLAPAANSGAKKALDYFDREDVVYIDLRDANSYAKGHIEGFEWIPHFDLIMANGGAKGHQLFWTDDKGTPDDKTDDEIKATYEESVTLIKKMFPQDKVLFLMCQSGGRVVNTMNVLKECGYNMDKVYNIGGWNQISKDATYPKVACESAKLTVTYALEGLTPIA